MGYKRTGRPTGRPPHTRGRYLDDVISATTEGNPITVFDRIVSVVRLGLPFDKAAAAVGVPDSTAYEWQKQGARAARDVLNGRRKQRELTVHEERCWSFMDAIQEARAAAALDRMVRVEALARGGQLVETITEKVDGQGNVLEKTVKQQWREPSLQANTWLLEVVDPAVFGRHRLEITGADGGPIEVSPREFIVEKLGITEARLTGKPLELVVDTTATTVDDDDTELDLDDFDK